MGIASVLSMFGPMLLRLAEHAFSGKPKSGTDKMAWVQQSLHWLVETMLRGNIKLPDGTQLPADTKLSDDALKTALEVLLEQEKAAGTLTTQSVGEQQLYILKGYGVTLTPLALK